jgi:hypothetical protein
MPFVDTIVEIHVPLREAPGTPESCHHFPWIDLVEDFLAEQEDAEVHVDGEEYGESYVFFVTGPLWKISWPSRRVWPDFRASQAERSR